MNYKKLILMLSIFSILLVHGCSKENAEESLPKDDNTISQEETTNKSNKDVKTLDNLQLTSAETESSNYKIVTERYTNGEINIEYPQISGLNTEAEAKINKYIKDSIIKMESYQEFDPVNDNNEEKFEIKTQEKDFVSTLVKGYSYWEEAAHPCSYIKTYNMDLNTGTFKRLADTGKTAEYASKIFNGKGFTIKSEDAMKEELDNENASFYEDTSFYDAGTSLLYRKGYEGKSEQEIKQMLDGFDIDMNNPDYIPSGYSYYEDGKTVLCLEVSHALGDYLELVFD